ncbi:MAG: asparaginase domain-containing protein [Sphingomonadales bacterium]
MKNLRIIITGGTLDKVHNLRTEALDFQADGSSHIPEMLHLGRCYFPKIEVLFLKDSLGLIEADREELVQAVLAAPENNIVVTHGTGTLGETARYLAQHVTEKSVVLTGAMRPYSLHASDADFNLGGAIIAAQMVEPGVWGVMNGRVFPANKLNKNIDYGRFDIPPSQ